MGIPSIGSVVVLPYPYSDLSRLKKRPAIVVADAERGDWLLCQVTSKSYADIHAVTLTNVYFATGSLPVVSYARPGKLFTAHESLFQSETGILTDTAYQGVIQAMINFLQGKSES